MIILSIDHSTRSGFCCVNTETNVIETCQYVMVEKEEGKRYVEWLTLLHAMFQSCKPDVLVIEKANHMRNANISRFLIGLVAIEKMIAEEYDCIVHEVIPTTLKKALTGNGRAEKQDVAMSVLKHYNGILEPKDIEEYEYYKDKVTIKKTHYDKSDAVALNIYYQNLIYSGEV